MSKQKNGIELVRAKRPLIHTLTNVVVAQMTANGLLAIGAAPVMADAPEEVEEMVVNASALVLNIGTPSATRLEAMLLAGKEANRRNIPVVLDPVAVGATAFRTTWVERFLQDVRVDVIRGNVGEIAALANLKDTVRGVDTVITELDESTIIKLARQLQTTIVASGTVDLITNGTALTRNFTGSDMLTSITGSGCLLSAIIGAYTAVQKDPYIAAVEATSMYTIAAEQAARRATGAGSFYVQLFDELSTITDQLVADHQRQERREYE